MHNRILFIACAMGCTDDGLDELYIGSIEVTPSVGLASEGHPESLLPSRCGQTALESSILWRDLGSDGHCVRLEPLAGDDATGTLSVWLDIEEPMNLVRVDVTISDDSDTIGPIRMLRSAGDSHQFDVDLQRRNDEVVTLDFRAFQERPAPE